jgi:hypothetical protein
MSYTKRDIVTAALSELGLSSYAFDLSTDQLNQALIRLDAMIAEWNARGVKLGYPIPGTIGGSSLTDDSGIPDSAWTAVITNLGVQLAPSYGKIVSPQTLSVARQSWNTLLSLSAKPMEMKLGMIPLGSGNKNVGGTFVVPEELDINERPDQAVSFQ